MKTAKIWGLILAVCLVSVFAVAEKSDKKEDKRGHRELSRPLTEEPAGVPSVSPPRRSAEERQQAYANRVSKMTNAHKKAIAELEAIKKIAEEEKASRTVEALQKMIDEKEAEFKKQTEKLEKQSPQHQETKKIKTDKPAEPTDQKDAEKE